MHHLARVGLLEELTANQLESAEPAGLTAGIFASALSGSETAQYLPLRLTEQPRVETHDTVWLLAVEPAHRNNPLEVLCKVFDSFCAHSAASLPSPS